MAHLLAESPLGDGLAFENFPGKRKTKFKLLNFDAMAQFGDAPACLIDGLIPRQGVSVIWGAPKTGKSFLAIDIAMAAALGKQYRGRNTVEGPVVYLCLEGQSGFRQRLAAYRQRFLSNRTKPIPLYVVKDWIKLVRDHAALIQDITTLGIKPAAIVVDTLNRAIDGNENSTEDMAKFLDAASAISNGLHCAVILIHHCGHDQSRMRGSSTLLGNTDCHISVRRDVATGTIVAKVEAAKDLSDGLEISFKLEDVDLGFDRHGNRVTSCVLATADTPPAGKAKRGWSKSLAVFQRAMRSALKESGFVQEIDGNQVQVVLLDDVRKMHNATYIHDGEGDRKEAERKAWQRSFKSAQANNLIAGSNNDGKELIWIKSPSGTAGTPL